MSFAGFEDEVAKPACELKRPRGGAKKERLIKNAVDRKVESVMNLPPEARLIPQESPSRVQLAIDETGHCQILPSASPNKHQTTSFKENGSVHDTPSQPKQETNVPETPPPEQPDQTSAHSPNNAAETARTGNNAADSSRSKLEEFTFKQKMIEEQNRKRREMLNAAINSRKQQTDKEARKLDTLQKEMAKIDVMLTTDVRYLRNAIEEASFVFMDAQKRYEKAESEFVEAKLHLHSTLERKELLTDHLCAIIEQNELRKARKLEELMVELSLSIQSDPVQETVSLAELRDPHEFNTLKK